MHLGLLLSVAIVTDLKRRRPTGVTPEGAVRLRDLNESQVRTCSCVTCGPRACCARCSIRKIAGDGTAAGIQKETGTLEMKAERWYMEMYCLGT